MFNTILTLNNEYDEREKNETTNDVMNDVAHFGHSPIVSVVDAFCQTAVAHFLVVDHLLCMSGKEEPTWFEAFQERGVYLYFRFVDKVYQDVSA